MFAFLPHTCSIGQSCVRPGNCQFSKTNIYVYNFIILNWQANIAERGNLLRVNDFRNDFQEIKQGWCYKSSNKWMALNFSGFHYPVEALLKRFLRTSWIFNAETFKRHSRVIHKTLIEKLTQKVKKSSIKYHLGFRKNFKSSFGLIHGVMKNCPFKTPPPPPPVIPWSNKFKTYDFLSK